MNQFLPVSNRGHGGAGLDSYDFLIITGDAYVDHPSFGPAIISRVLEAEGYRVAILAQPDWRKASSFTALGRPRLGVMLSSGNIDSMVAPLYRGQEAPPRRRLFPGKQGRPAARPGGDRLRQQGAGGLWGHPR